MKRRDFLKQCTLTSGAFMAPAFLKPLDLYSNPTYQFRKLVLVHLQGGNDGLNTVVPYSNDTYYRKRPKLAIPSDDIIRVNDSFGFNPALKSLMKIYDKGQMLVLNNVGYNGVQSSHYTSSQFWESSLKNVMMNAIKTNHDTYAEHQIKADSFINEENFGVCDEHDFENRLLKISSRIYAGSQTEIYRIALDGFDTHQFQRLKQDRLLNAYAKGISSFVKKLSLSGRFDETLIMTYSEFGRATAENAKHGTEHGSANSMFLFGNKLKHEGISNTPLNLEGEIIDSEIDLRSVYATIKKSWFRSSDIASKNTYPVMNWI